MKKYRIALLYFILSIPLLAQEETAGCRLYFSDIGIYDFELKTSIDDFNLYKLNNFEEEIVTDIIEYVTAEPLVYDKDIFRKVIFPNNETTLIFNERVMILNKIREVKYVLRYNNDLLCNYVIYIYCGDLKCYQFYNDLIELLEKFGNKNTYINKERLTNYHTSGNCKRTFSEWGDSVKISIEILE